MKNIIDYLLTLRDTFMEEGGRFVSDGLITDIVSSLSDSEDCIRESRNVLRERMGLPAEKNTPPANLQSLAFAYQALTTFTPELMEQAEAIGMNLEPMVTATVENILEQEPPSIEIREQYFDDKGNLISDEPLPLVFTVTGKTVLYPTPPAADIETFSRNFEQRVLANLNPPVYPAPPPPMNMGDSPTPNQYDYCSCSRCGICGKVRR